MSKHSFDEMRKRPTMARVVRWVGFGWGVAFAHGDGKHDAYPVGPSREDAEVEARRLQSGGRPRSPRDVVRTMTGSSAH
jgi:hypothetical protein